MARKLFRGITACAVTGLLLLTAVPAVHAQENEPPAPGGSAGENTLVDRIVAAAESGEASPEQIAEQAALPLEGAGSLSFDAAQRMSVTVMFAGTPREATLASVTAIAEVDVLSVKFGAATVHIDPARLTELTQIPGVLMAYPTIEGMTGQGSTAPGNKAPRVRPAAAMPDGTACGPIPIEADSPLRSEEARAAFGVDGTGVTIGIISDSFNLEHSVTSWADDVESGALPGPGNPCGRETPVEVVGEAATGADEGRGMAQLVHGIAPGAKLLFHNGMGGEVVMMEAINALVDAGADIIVDDLGFGTALTYQQGLVSYAVMEARAQGVAYFTALGNSNVVGQPGTPSEGLPISSWQTAKYRPMTCPTWVFDKLEEQLSPDAVDCMDFDPGAGETAYDTLLTRTPADGEPMPITVVGSVGEPLLGVTTNYELRYFSVATDGTTTQLGEGISRLSPYHPNFIGGVELPVTSEIRMVMVRTGYDASAPNPAFMISHFSGGQAISTRAHLGDGVNDWVGETPLGHAGDGSATSVGSLHWDEATKMRSYSSLGPSTMLFEAINLTDATPANRFPAPKIVTAPDVAAVDGTQTTFFGAEEGSDPANPEYRFYGTSAAAPNAAAVAALGLSYAPELSQAELTQLLLETANPDVVNPYAPRFEDKHVFGSGRVDAMALLEALPERPTVQELKLAGATAGELQFTWQAGSAERFVIELYKGTIAPANVVEASQLPAGTASYTFSGLESDSAYVVRLAPYGEFGVTGDASTLDARTLAASGAAGGGSGGGSDGNAGAGGAGAAVSGDTGTKNPNGSLKDTGSEAATPVLIGAGAILVLGGVAFAIGLSRRKKAGTAME